jgi:hypothetical protein
MMLASEVYRRFLDKGDGEVWMFSSRERPQVNAIETTVVQYERVMTQHLGAPWDGSADQLRSLKGGPDQDQFTDYADPNLFAIAAFNAKRMGFYSGQVPVFERPSPEERHAVMAGIRAQDNLTRVHAEVQHRTDTNWADAILRLSKFLNIKGRPNGYSTETLLDALIMCLQAARLTINFIPKDFFERETGESYGNIWAFDKSKKGASYLRNRDQAEARLLHLGSSFPVAKPHPMRDLPEPDPYVRPVLPAAECAVEACHHTLTEHTVHCHLCGGGFCRRHAQKRLDVSNPISAETGTASHGTLKLGVSVCDACFDASIVDFAPNGSYDRCHFEGCNSRLRMAARHHCRMCGQMFCGSHTKHRATVARPVDPKTGVRQNVEAPNQRICDTCYPIALTCFAPVGAYDICRHDGCDTRLRSGARHHCRRCGQMFCNGHSQKRLNVQSPIDPKTGIHQNTVGFNVRVCDECYTEVTDDVAEVAFAAPNLTDAEKSAVSADITRYVWAGSADFNSDARPRYGALDFAKAKCGGATMYGRSYFEVAHPLIFNCTFTHTDSFDALTPAQMHDWTADWFNLYPLITHMADSKLAKLISVVLNPDRENWSAGAGQHDGYLEYQLQTVIRFSKDIKKVFLSEVEMAACTSKVRAKINEFITENNIERIMVDDRVYPKASPAQNGGLPVMPAWPAL